MAALTQLNALAKQNPMVREEFVGQVVGVRRGVLYVQWRLQAGGGGSLDRSVAIPVGDAAFVAAHYRVQEVAPPAEGAARLLEPPSWCTPFRNDMLEEELQRVERAPFDRERWASLIPGKYTPKVKKFNYAQHNENDDYETKEYRDRLLSRQFFHDPQRFEILPDRREKSVAFEGKESYRQVAGVPTADRHELQRGTAHTEPISDAEMGVVEQALRDISGSRGGNFIKSATEAAQLRLNESWWAPLEVGWQQRNAAAQLAGGGAALTDPSRLPFQGKIPPFGTSYGIGERIRDITEDFRKGFGLGPHKRSPENDFHRFDTLRSEQERVARLGLGRALVRLFDDK
ncbi:hypothetical protein STCU_11636 [Strigomonas culicis]|uniref:Uncharacterized protein n=1 Tax=Strigomonas culicis TaxID=28005 RepID=S9TD68_9TRYP|nr:hypothetical protein STCU_11636 [Strigomonas culicis]|eukprot:EPY15967.1 hypothetical protein STCU_11636 [Strigomonas culicis]